jgi:succinate-acetate transporter protein
MATIDQRLAPAATLMLVTAFRSTIATRLALTLLVATLFVLGAGNYAAEAGLVHTAGWMGIILVGLAFYLALAKLCEVSYGREILPAGYLAKS